MPARQRPRRTSPLNLPSAFDLFAPSRELVMKHLDVFGVLFILPFFFWIHSWISTPAHGGHYYSRFSDTNYSWSGFPGGFFAAFIGFSILWFAITIAAGTVVNIMLQKAQLDAAEGHTPSLQRGWETAKQLGWRLLGLYVAIALIITVGFILLVIPGFFMIRRYMLAPYVLLDKKCSIREALDESARLSLINTGAVWGLMGVMLLISLLGIVPLIGSLASFIVGALYSVAPALRYQQLKKLA